MSEKTELQNYNKINTLDEYNSLVFLQYNTTMYRNEYIWNTWNIERYTHF